MTARADPPNVRRLSDDELAALREDMQQAGAAMRQALTAGDRAALKATPEQQPEPQGIDSTE